MSLFHKAFCEYNCLPHWVELANGKCSHKPHMRDCNKNEYWSELKTRFMWIFTKLGFLHWAVPVRFDYLIKSGEWMKWVWEWCQINSLENVTCRNYLPLLMSSIAHFWHLITILMFGAYWMLPAPQTLADNLPFHEREEIFSCTSIPPEVDIWTPHILKEKRSKFSSPVSNVCL